MTASRRFFGFIKPSGLLHVCCTAALALVAYAFIAVLMPSGANADGTGVLGNCPDNNGLNELPRVYCLASLTWLSNGLQAAQRFFTLLVGIEFAWTFILWALQKDNLGELVSALVIKVMGVAFFYFILLNQATQNFLPKIMMSFAQLGGVVTGNPSDFLDNPTGIFETGTAICRMIFQHMPYAGFYFDVLNISNSIYDDLFLALAMLCAGIFAVVISFVVFISFLVVAGQLIMTLIEAYIMIGGGAVLLGFTGSRWTMSFGEKWFGYAFAIGVKLFVISLIIGLGATLFPTNCGGADPTGICFALNDIGQVAFYHASDFYTYMPNVIVDYLIIGGTCVIFMMLAQRLPGLAASMMNGSPSLSMGAAMGALGQVVSAASGGFNAVTSTAMGTLDSVVGAAQGAAQAGMDTVNELQENAKEAAMMVAGGGMGGGAEAAGGGGGGMMSGVSGGASGGGASGSGASSSGGGGSDMLSSMPGLEKNSGVVVAKGAIKAGTAIASGTKDAVVGVANGAQDLAMAAAGPLMSMDEGGGGGSVSIGLKLPE